MSQKLTPGERARALLDNLNLPRDVDEILRQPKYWNVAFCRLYLESCESLRFDAPEAGLAAAQVAPSLAARVPTHHCEDEEGWCSLQLDALGILGAAHRTVGDLQFAEQVFLIAIKLFADDANDLARSRLIRRLAYLRAAQGRLQEARELVDEAIEVYHQLRSHHTLGCALVDRAVIYGRGRQYELAARDLLEAEDLLVEGRDPRYHYSTAHNLAYALIKMKTGDPQEAMSRLRRAYALIDGQTAALSRAKLFWLEGEALAQMGAHRDAKSTLDLARKQLQQQGAKLDAALAGLTLAEILVAEGSLDEVRRLCGQLFPTFQALRNHRDAFEALKLFHRAALEQTLTLKILGQVKEVLERATPGI